jgi:hypothetical protein
MKKRGQYSAEAILILSILLLVVLSIISFREDLMSGVTKTYYSSKSRTTTDLILQTAELVYHQGGGARSIIFVSIPKEMINITLSSNILVVNMNISNTPQSFFRTVPFNFNGTIPNEEGNHCLLIESFSGYVEVSEYEGSC